MFCSEIINDHAAIRNEEASYVDIPQFGKVTQADILSNFIQIKSDVAAIIQNELEKNDGYT